MSDKNNFLYSKEKHAIIELKDADYDRLVESHKIMLITLYLPNCKYWKLFEIELNKLKPKLNQQEIALAKVDMTKPNRTFIRNKLFADASPTIYLVKKNVIELYRGSRDAKTLFNVLLNEINNSNV